MKANETTEGTENTERTAAAAADLFGANEKHWLVRFAETVDLGGLEWDAEMSINSMLVGALREIRSGRIMPARVSMYRKLIDGHEEAEKVIKARRAEKARKG